jgi:parvulin-like peptidyl-prolyl isomerase
MPKTLKEITKRNDFRATLRKKFAFGSFIPISLILLVCLFLSSGCGKLQPQPPSKDVVATCSGNTLTKEDLRNYLRKTVIKEEEHAICEKHGFDHSKCDKLESCEVHPLHSLEALRLIIKNIVLEKITQDWAKEKGVTQRKEVKHGLKHLVEEVNLEGLVANMHKEDLAPDKIEIQQYYDSHKDEYKNKSLKEAEDEIKSILATKKHGEFIPQYIEKLKENAAISTNYDLLKVDPATETELRDYYTSRKDEYIEPVKVKVSEIKIDISNSEDAARKQAEEIMIKLRSQESFEEVAKRFSKGSQESYYIKEGEKNKAFEENVFNLGVNELSPVFKDGGTYYIIKLLERQDKRQKQFGEVTEELKTKVMREKENRLYELNKSEAIFSMHGKRFTLAEFREEFGELSPEAQAAFSSFEAKKNLVDQLIIKELLVEEAGDKIVGEENKEVTEDLKNEIMRQILHQEEVDEKIEEPLDSEAKEIYEKKKAFFVEPAKAKISYIRINQGSSDDERKKARQKIEEAYQKIKSGVDFVAVAKEFSEDRNASSGGELGQWIYEGASHLGEMMEHDLHETIFKLRPDETSNIFEFADSFFIVKIRQKEDKRQMAFEEAKSHIKELLRMKKHHEKTSALQDELLKKSKLVIYDSSLKEMLKEEKQKEPKGSGRR